MRCILGWYFMEVNSTFTHHLSFSGNHYDDVIMTTIASQITSLMVVYSTVYSDADQRKHQSSASLAFVQGIHRIPVNSPHKWPVTRKKFPFDDVIMRWISFTKLLAMGHFGVYLLLFWTTCCLNSHHSSDTHEYITQYRVKQFEISIHLFRSSREIGTRWTLCWVLLCLAANWSCPHCQGYLSGAPFIFMV